MDPNDRFAARGGASRTSGPPGSAAASDGDLPAPARRAVVREAVEQGGRRGSGNAADTGDPVRRRGRKRKKVSRKRKWIKRISIGLSVSLVVVVGGAVGIYLYLNGSLRHSPLNTSNVKPPGAAPDAFGRTPLNILVIGSDTRSGAGDCDLGGGCQDSTGWGNGDVQMLIHVSADRSNGSVISIPRDTRVDIPTCTDPKTGRKTGPTDEPITDALDKGGPGCVVGTWDQLLQIKVDHFLMVDFAGVVKMADALGGVKVCVAQNIRDDQVYTDNHGVRHDVGSHLRLSAGTQEIKGQTALEWLRTRHAFEGGDDVGRAKAQHMYMSSLVKKAKSTDMVSNPVKLLTLAKAAVDALTVDDGLPNVQDLVGLVNTIKKVPANRLTMLTMPHVADPRDPLSHLVPAPDAAKLWAMVRGDVPFDRNTNGAEAGALPPASATPTAVGTSAPAESAPPAIDPATIPVDVVNGATGKGMGATVANGLNRKGFTQASADTRSLPKSTTVLLYPTGHQEAAGEVADALGLPRSAMRGSGSATRVTVEIGRDWPAGSALFGVTGGGAEGGAAQARPSPSATLVPGDIPSADTQAVNAGDDIGCMRVYTAARYPDGTPIYTW